MKLNNQTIPMKLEIRRITKVKDNMSWSGFEFGYQIWINGKNVSGKEVLTTRVNNIEDTQRALEAIWFVIENLPIFQGTGNPENVVKANLVKNSKDGMFGEILSQEHRLIRQAF